MKFKDCPFPYYGLAPHTHGPRGTTFAPREEWPANYRPDIVAGTDGRVGAYVCPHGLPSYGRGLACQNCEHAVDIRHDEKK